MIAAALAAAVPMVVAYPAHVRSFWAIGKRAKTDPISVIAHFIEATKSQLRQLPTPPHTPISSSAGARSWNDRSGKPSAHATSPCLKKRYRQKRQILEVVLKVL